eukprot:g114.t1
MRSASEDTRPIRECFDSQRVLVENAFDDALATSTKEVDVMIDVSLNATPVEELLVAIEREACEKRGETWSGGDAADKYSPLLDRVTHAVVFGDKQYPTNRTAVDELRTLIDFGNLRKGAALVIDVGAKEDISLTHFSHDVNDSVDALQDKITKVMASVYDNVPELGGFEADTRSIRHACALQEHLQRGARRYRREATVLVFVIRMLFIGTTLSLQLVNLAALIRSVSESSIYVYLWYAPARDPVTRSPSGYVGLANQGATCYMNSLLQGLFMTPEFRAAMFKWRFKPGEEGDEEAESMEDSIPFQLQRLFGMLQLTTRRAVETKDLTASFGWTSRDTFQQHDVQELARILFDKIEESFRGTPQEHLVNELYRGTMVDFVACKDCGFERSRPDPFLDISLVIKPFGSATLMHSVEDALRHFLKPELLDGDNQWECERCKCKVDAFKGLKFTQLPPLLTLQLKRFDFDFETLGRVKIHDRVSFPTVLDMNRFVSDSKAEAKKDNGGCDCSGSDGGGGEGGDDGDPAAAEAGIDEAFAAEAKRQLSAEAQSSAPSSTDGQGGGDSTSGGAGGGADDERVPDLVDAQGNPAPHGLDGKKGTPRADEADSAVEVDAQQLLRDNGPWVYELFAVLVHSGSAMGGHYFAYIKDLARGEWFKFNDSTVSHVNLSEVRSAYGGKSSWASAYMLLYRQLQPESSLPLQRRQGANDVTESAGATDCTASTPALANDAGVAQQKLDAAAPAAVNAAMVPPTKYLWPPASMRDSTLGDLRDRLPPYAIAQQKYDDLELAKPRPSEPDKVGSGDDKGAEVGKNNSSTATEGTSAVTGTKASKSSSKLASSLWGGSAWARELEYFTKDIAFVTREDSAREHKVAFDERRTAFELKKVIEQELGLLSSKASASGAERESAAVYRMRKYGPCGSLLSAETEAKSLQSTDLCSVRKFCIEAGRPLRDGEIILAVAFLNKKIRHLSELRVMGDTLRGEGSPMFCLPVAQQEAALPSEASDSTATVASESVQEEDAAGFDASSLFDNAFADDECETVEAAEVKQTDAELVECAVANKMSGGAAVAGNSSSQQIIAKGCAAPGGAGGENDTSVLSPVLLRFNAKTEPTTYLDVGELVAAPSSKLQDVVLDASMLLLQRHGSGDIALVKQAIEHYEQAAIDLTLKPRSTVWTSASSAHSSAFARIAGTLPSSGGGGGGGSSAKAGRLGHLDLASASPLSSSRHKPAKQRVERGLRIRTKKDRLAEERQKQQDESENLEVDAKMDAGTQIDYINAPNPPPASPVETFAGDEAEFSKQESGMELFSAF